MTKMMMTTYTDKTLSILYDPSTDRGKMWAAGRSIVIHKDDGSRWACANLGEAGGGVDVVFLGYEVQGSIELFQPMSGYAQFAWAYETNSHYSTSVAITTLSGLEASPGNKWHVHVDPVVTAGDCLATGGHYDPLGANYSENDDAPPPYEIGDLSGKLGRLNGDTGYFMGTIGPSDSSQGYALDNALPLVGDNSVLGRSIVIHKANGDRWVCATILNNPTYTYLPPPPPPPSPPSLDQSDRPTEDSPSDLALPIIIGIVAGSFALVTCFVCLVMHKRQQQNKPGRVKRGETPDPEAGYQMNVKDQVDLQINEA